MVSFRLADELLETIDALAQQEGLTRTDWLHRAIGAAAAGDEPAGMEKEDAIGAWKRFEARANAKCQRLQAERDQMASLLRSATHLAHSLAALGTRS